MTHLFDGCNWTLYRCVCGHPGAKNRDYSVVTRFSARARKTAPAAGALPKAILGTQIQCQVAPLFDRQRGVFSLIGAPGTGKIPCTRAFSHFRGISGRSFHSRRLRITSCRHPKIWGGTAFVPTKKHGSRLLFCWEKGQVLFRRYPFIVQFLFPTGRGCQR
jgi:hypothetical protein